MGGVIQLLKTIGTVVPHQYLFPILIVLCIAGFPTFLHSVKTKQLKSQVREVAKAATLDVRKLEEDRAIAMTERSPRRLIALADAAIALNQRGLAERAISELASVEHDPRDIARLQRELAPPKTHFVAHPIEAIVTIKRLMDQGLTDLARQRLAEAQERFPGDEELAALKQKLAEQSEVG